MISAKLKQRLTKEIQPSRTHRLLRQAIPRSPNTANDTEIPIGGPKAVHRLRNKGNPSSIPMPMPKKRFTSDDVVPITEDSRGDSSFNIHR